MGSNILTCGTCLFRIQNYCKLNMVMTVNENDSACYRHSDLEKSNNDFVLDSY